ncbi:MAG: bifunctional nuclease family protein [Chloroflexi bacterium]|nr:bifunctional nuclease family protein [Chloroflexota bacterium]
MLEVSVESVRMSLMSPHRVIVLKEVDEERYLPIWIGPYEADAIAIELQGMETPRPLSHDLLKQAILTLGGRVSHVVVHGLRNDTFFASVVLDQGGQELELDARPSDSIALAVRTKAKIFVDSAVMAQAGMKKEEDLRQQMQRQRDTEDLEVFREFLEELDLNTVEGEEDT